jgi:hypothetical protein
MALSNTSNVVLVAVPRSSSLPAMQAGARTPEELETLLEDAFLMRDRGALSGLFAKRAVLGGGDGSQVAHGRTQIVQAATMGWAREEAYIAAPLRVLQTRNTALITSGCAISVARRSSNGAWHYSIALLRSQPQPQPRRSTR